MSDASTSLLTDGLALLLLSFALTAMVSGWIVRTLRRLKAGQVIQKDGPQSHQSKAGTPTMGGIAILLGMLIPCVVAVRSASMLPGGDSRILSGLLAVVVLAVVYALIGFVDDCLTMRPRNGRRGLSSKMKFAFQLIAAVLFVVWLSRTGNLHPVISLGSLFRLDLGWAYAPLAVLFITGMSNFINITDGLDGLAAGLTIILAGMMAVTPVLMGASVAASPVAVLLFALVGACMAFLWINYNPAKVFMGDTGSLMIGALIPAAAIVMKLEIPMIIAGMVFILDGLSSALQWAVFKYTRIRTGTGKRVFRMSPIHHHFELSGWPEQLVVVRFWIVGAVCSVIALLLVLVR
jgi:phospho-N-acetylmuramoyl-pentapeptide-transferase